jgi:hypothetical protein
MNSPFQAVVTRKVPVLLIKVVPKPATPPPQEKEK